MSKQKGTRVWVAVDRTMWPYVYTARRRRKYVADVLDVEWAGTTDWRENGITIRRATLIVDPPKKRKRKPT